MLTTLCTTTVTTITTFLYLLGLLATLLWPLWLLTTLFMTTPTTNTERRHGSLQITRLCHRHLQLLVCFQTSTIECQEDGSSLVWNGGWTPQGGSSRQMSHYRFWRYSTSRCGSELGCLLRCSSVNEGACGSSCPVLLLPSSSSALDTTQSWTRRDREIGIRLCHFKAGLL